MLTPMDNTERERLTALLRKIEGVEGQHERAEAIRALLEADSEPE